jgi:hypothetical protein
LDHARLFAAHLEGTTLTAAALRHADLTVAHLEHADLTIAHLEGADLRLSSLDGANLTGASFDPMTILSGVVLTTRTRLGDIHWGGVGRVNLTQIAWSTVPTLGDEQGVEGCAPLGQYAAAVRAYRQVATQLRAQGLSEEANRFAERAHVRRRKHTFRQLRADWRRPWRLPGDLLRWLCSWFLAVLTGYGYHLGRSVLWYLASVAGFAALFFQASHTTLALGLPVTQLHPLRWYDALGLSVSSFHGLDFFLSTGLNGLGDPIMILVSVEAVIGLVIEIGLIIAFIQRVFGAK